MTKYKYIGRTNYQCGKTLWEIIGNLKDYGVGRLVTKGVFYHYPEPSFFKIVKAEAYPQTEADVVPGRHRKCIVWVEKVFRGRRYPTISEILRVSYKPDYRLIPKDEEHLWYEKVVNMPIPEPFIPPTHIDVPPVLKLILNEERQSKGQPVEEDMVTKACTRRNFLSVRCVKELPEKNILRGYGKSSSQSLYENIEAYKISFLNENKSE